MGDGINFYIQTAVAVGLAVSGLIFTHYFTSKRDRKNAERLMRLDELKKAYSAFVRSGTVGSFTERDHEGKLIPTAREVEDAMAAIHLFGSEHDSKLVNKYSEDVSTTNSGNSTELINSLRKEIRSELGLPQLSTEPSYLSIKIFNTNENHSKNS